MEKELKDYKDEITEHFSGLPEVANPLLRNAKKTFKWIERKLYSAPAFIQLVKASVSEQVLQAVMTDEQKKQIASGVLKLMTKKDGTLMANLVNPETQKIVSTISLERVGQVSGLSEAIVNYGAQMQMAMIVEEIHKVQLAVEEVRQGLEFDRLAMAYSCQQKLLQAMQINSPELKSMALLRIVADAEDGRNLLMQSQNVNLAFIKGQPISFWKKFLKGAQQEEISKRMNEIRASLSAVNLLSLVEVMAYQELGEDAASRQSLQYYADYLQQAYVSKELLERLDSIDPAPENYWSETLPKIQKRIQVLPRIINVCFLEEEDGGQ